MGRGRRAGLPRVRPHRVDRGRGKAEEFEKTLVVFRVGALEVAMPADQIFGGEAGGME